MLKDYSVRLIKDLATETLAKSDLKSVKGKYVKSSSLKSYLRNFNSHRLRHSLSTELYKNRANILGHSNVNTNKRYIHPDLDTKSKDV